MSEYNAYGEQYNLRPKLKIAERLKDSGEIERLIVRAESDGFEVSFTRGRMLLDVVVERPERGQMPLTVQGAKRYFKL